MSEIYQPETKYCRNCGHSMGTDALYCDHCGQKYTTGRITFWELLREFFQEIFSLDSKIFRTVGALFIPGRLTNEYFAGRHRRYAHPIRLFFITAVVFFALLSIVANKKNENAGLTNMDSELYEKAYRSKFLDELDKARDSILSRLPEGPLATAVLDTLNHFLENTGKSDRNLEYVYFTGDWSLKDTSIHVDYLDLVSLSRDSFFAKYQIQGVLAQTIVKQNIRLQTNPGDFMRYLLGQMIWMVLLMMPVLALILKLFYIRRRRYYIEHLIFSFHYHAFGFVIFCLPLLLMALPFDQTKQLKTLQTWAYVIAGLALAVYLFTAMRRVYRQGWFKTFVKFSALNFLYIFVFISMISMVSVVSLLLY